MRLSSGISGVFWCVLALQAGLAGAQQYDTRGNVIPGTEPPPKIDKIPKERPPERDVPPPAPPRAENLLPIDVPQFPGRDVFLDRTSIVIGPDEIVRYTLVATTASGLRQVSYEGVRCGPDQWRSYFLGRQDGGWGKDFASGWMRVSNAGPGAIRFLLAESYFCTPEGRTVSSVDEVLDRIASGGSSVMRRRRNN